jgi:ribonuclease BN (tRNA processing enzyme)
MARLTFLGVGGAFTMKNWQSNMLLETADGKRLLIDCGGDCRFALAERGLTAKDIGAVYISHCHADHIGGLEWLGFSRYFTPGPKPDLYINERLADALWEHSLKGGMASHQGVLLTLDSFFNAVHRIPGNGHFDFGDCRLQPVQTIHYMDGYEIVPSYGLLIDRAAAGGGEYFLTTDTQFCPNLLMDFYERSHLIFHDCETYDLTGKIRSGVHAHYTELKTLPSEVRAKMWLYHYNDGPLPDAAADGFAGLVRKGQAFELDRS